MDEIRLANIFAAADGMLFHDENRRSTINPDIALKMSDLGGRHRVRIMDELRLAANGNAVPTPDDKIEESPYYTNIEKFVDDVALVVSLYQYN